MAMTIETFQELLNLGTPMAVLIVIAVFGWRISKYLATRLLDEDKGIVVEWLRENKETQTKLREYMRQENKRAQAAQEIHDAQLFVGEAIKRDVTAMKTAARPACKLFRELAEAWPAKADSINAHVDEMERILEVD